MKNYKLRGTIEPVENKSRRFYFEDPKMSASEKKRLANEVLANERIEKIRQELLKYLENWNYETYPKITQASLRKNRFKTSFKAIFKTFKGFMLTYIPI
ncbi:hypothetical protein REB14_10495 [Chryseobacterium sp. ES2]|uniref:Uncharacterized protein n=1 Tax=Chryseobacterium metallicongregator TaxID=3073042 RepID=A0ABU1E483_9FLAO|nr:hypothetical protein [Chryseobacterium sp. ES2]MDR4952604.1 hypothetical protein [Chryseobacterium sp. ES2]